MLIESNFQSDSNDREILPAEFSSHPYICMLTDLIKYNGIFPWHWHSALEIDYIIDGDIEFQMPEHKALLKRATLFLSIPKYCTPIMPETVQRVSFTPYCSMHILFPACITVCLRINMCILF